MLLPMAEVTLTLPQHRYTIRIQPGLLGSLGEQVREVAPHGRAALIVDENIEKSHGRVAARALDHASYEAVIAVMPPGEENKTLGTVRGMYEVLVNAGLERKSPVIALGGGITGDTAGFVAATYLRGVPFIQCPTTLLAMVDASVGGKVGVNVPQGKNLIGAFYQPHLVLIDTDTLRTLPDRELRCGLAECIKHGIIKDLQLFQWISGHVQQLKRLDSDTLVKLVEWNVRIKADVVMADEKEQGERAMLNFGHTFGHAIEAATEYGSIHHGEAVALGMVAATHLACELKLCSHQVLEQLTQLLEAVGLPTCEEKLPPVDVLMAYMKTDKKVANQRLRLVLPTKIGQVVLRDDIPENLIRQAWQFIASR